MNKPPPGEDLPALFRSLRPDTASFQATLDAAAHEAVQRWPLFKALSPKTPEPTPALSTEERLQWSLQEKPPHAERKQALTRLGLSDKLTKSLDKMSGLESKTLVAPAPAAPTLVAPATEHKPERTLPRRNKALATTKPVESPVMLFATPAQTADLQVETKTEAKIEAEAEAEAAAAAEVQVVPTSLGLFGKKAAAEAAAPQVAPKVLLKQAEHKAADVEMPMATDDSLAGIFERLLEKERVVSKPAIKKSSFLGRLGKK